MKDIAFDPKKDSQSVERLFISSSGDPINGILPKIRGQLGDVFSCEIAFPAGYYAVLEKDDEVITINPFKDGINKAIIGVIPNYMFDLPPGSRMMYTENAQMILTKDGKVLINSIVDTKIQSDGDIVISNGNGNITLNANGVIDLN